MKNNSRDKTRKKPKKKESEEAKKAKLRRKRRAVRSELLKPINKQAQVFQLFRLIDHSHLT